MRCSKALGRGFDNLSTPCAALQVGAPRPVAWFHFFDKNESREWNSFLWSCPCPYAAFQPLVREALCLLCAALLLCVHVEDRGPVLTKKNPRLC